MVRTKADRVPAKAVGSKTARKVQAGPSTKKTIHKKSNYGGGHSRAHPRETPKWQKPITSFILTDKISATEIEMSTSKEEIENQDPTLNIEKSTDEEALNLEKNINEETSILDSEESTDEDSN